MAEEAFEIAEGAMEIAKDTAKGVGNIGVDFNHGRRSTFSRIRGHDKYAGCNSADWKDNKGKLEDRHKAPDNNSADRKDNKEIAENSEIAEHALEIALGAVEIAKDTAKNVKAEIALGAVEIAKDTAKNVKAAGNNSPDWKDYKGKLEIKYMVNVKNVNTLTVGDGSKE